MTNEAPDSSVSSSPEVAASLTDTSVLPAGNLLFALAAGIVAAVVGAAIWAAITVATEYQIGWMAVGVGFLVGIAVRRFGMGNTPVYGVIGAVFALAGCLLGNVLSLVGFISISEEMSFFATLGALDYAQVPTILIETGSPIYLLFYAIAISGGYKTSMLQGDVG
jgi:hypothetical protein